MGSTDPKGEGNLDKAPLQTTSDPDATTGELPDNEGPSEPAVDYAPDGGNQPVSKSDSDRLNRL